MVINPGRDMRDAPRDRRIRVWAPEYQGLPAIFAICQWHPDAGFCIDELREPVMWWDLPHLVIPSPSRPAE